MLSIIAAVANNHVIGINNSLPWKIVEDLQYFKNKTLNRKIIMGRKTFDSLGRPLPSRTNIVLSRGNDDRSDIVYSNLDEVISYASSDEEIFIIGGSEIYHLLMPYVQRMYITDIFLDVAGDTFFPIYDLSEWDTHSTQIGDYSIQADEEDVIHYEFIRFDRKK